MSQEPVRNFNDLLERLDALVEAAEAGEVDPVLADYLRATRERLVLLRERKPGGQRLAERYEATGEARLVVRGYGIPVRIRDRSATGFGLVSDEPVDPETYARLDIDGAHEEEMYEGLVTHCQPEEAEYRLGFEIISSLRIG